MKGQVRADGAELERVKSGHGCVHRHFPRQDGRRVASSLLNGERKNERTNDGQRRRRPESLRELGGHQIEASSDVDGHHERYKSGSIAPICDRMMLIVLYKAFRSWLEDSHIHTKYGPQCGWPTMRHSFFNREKRVVAGTKPSC